MSTVVESVDVAVPVRTAYDQWTQFEEFPQFMEGVKEIRQVDDTLTHWVVEIGGVTREFDARITEQHPDERVAWTSVDGPRHAGVVTFHRLDEDHSRVTAQMDIDPEGFIENVADKVGLLDRRVKADLKRFREFIEERGTETAGWRGEVDAGSSSTVKGDAVVGDSLTGSTFGMDPLSGGTLGGASRTTGPTGDVDGQR